MTTSISTESVADRFGRKIAARLSAGQADLPYVVTERLRASREQALSMRKRAVSTVARPAQEATLHSVQMGADGSATLGTGPSGWMPQWLRHALTALPIAAMVAGDITLDPNMGSALAMVLVGLMLVITAAQQWLLKRSYHVAR